MTVWGALVLDHVLLDVFDNVANGLDISNFIVFDRAPKLILEFLDKLDKVKRIGPEAGLALQGCIQGDYLVFDPNQWID